MHVCTITMRILRSRAILTASLIVAASAVWAAADPPYSKEHEERIGQEAAAQVESQYDLFEDEEAQQKLDRMASIIAASSTRPDVEYDVRLLDTEQVNAFSLPGGIIFVTRGLLEHVHSDHELAGVMAHEIAHNCTYDGLRQADRNRDLFTGSIAAAIAAILIGAGSDVISGVFMAGEYVRRGVLGGYSIEMETAADRNAVKFLIPTEYNTVGLLTFMERLAADYRREPQVELGVFQTHPLASERVSALARQISAHGLEINHRATTRWDHPTAEAVEEGVEDSPLRVSLWEEEVFVVAVPGPGHETVADRAEDIVSRLTELLKLGMRSHELQIGDRDGAPALGTRAGTILTIYPEDAEAHEKSALELAQEARLGIQRALFKERLQRLY